MWASRTMCVAMKSFGSSLSPDVARGDDQEHESAEDLEHSVEALEDDADVEGLGDETLVAPPTSQLHDLPALSASWHRTDAVGGFPRNALRAAGNR